MPTPKKILYLTENEVKQTLTISQAVNLAEKGIIADAKGNVVGDKFYMDVGDYGFIKPFSGYISGEEFAYVKTFSNFSGNRELYNIPPTSSVVLLFDSKTGLPVCVMEASWVTGLKTAASTAVTTTYLAQPESQIVTIFGAGTLGRLHMQAVAERFNLTQGYFVDILPDVANKCASDLEIELGFSIDAVHLEDCETIVRESDILITVTTGNQPLFEYSWLKAGAFIARLGSYQEIAYDVIMMADKVIVDRWKYVGPRIPEIIHLVRSGQFKVEDVYAEWPSVVAGDATGRESPDEIIIFIALGIWGEYAAMLPEVYRRAIEKGIGQNLIRSQSY